MALAVGLAMGSVSTMEAVPFHYAGQAFAFGNTYDVNVFVSREEVCFQLVASFDFVNFFGAEFVERERGGGCWP